MASTLKAGGLGLDTHVGIPPQFADSMAEAMEEALNDLLVAEGKPALSLANDHETRDRRTLFVAIARGVVNHLVANAAAFKVLDDLNVELANHHVHIDGA